MQEFELLTKKLAENQIDYKISDETFLLMASEENEENKSETRQKVVFYINRGRDSEEFRIVPSSRNIRYLLDCDFENYRFVKGYEAIWSKTNGIIECELDGRFYAPSRFFQSIKNSIVENQSDEMTQTVEETFDSEIEEAYEHALTEVELFKVKNISVKIGLCSKVFATLKGCRQRGRNIDSIMSRTVTLKFENCSINKHDEALAIITKLGLAIEFLFNEKHSLDIRMLTEQKYTNAFRNSRDNEKKNAKLDIPVYEYDVEPMSLYLHGRSRDLLPLYSYLAFYQVLEYYFPKYSEIEIKNGLRRTLKDPKFDLDNDGHLVEILELIKANKSGGYSDELTQLKSVISGCVSDREIKKFLSDNDFGSYLSKNSWKLISEKKISMNNENTEIMNQVTNRIYDIRCNIVHKKSSFINSNNILPQSISYYDILNDIDLIKFLSYKVLVANSKLLNI